MPNLKKTGNISSVCWSKLYVYGRSCSIDCYLGSKKNGNKKAHDAPPGQLRSKRGCLNGTYPLIQHYFLYGSKHTLKEGDIAIVNDLAAYDKTLRKHINQQNCPPKLTIQSHQVQNRLKKWDSIEQVVAKNFWLYSSIKM